MTAAAPVKTEFDGITGRRFDVRELMRRSGAATANDFAEMMGEPVTTIRGRLDRGVTWEIADQMAIKLGMFPGEVWPDWDFYSPTDDEIRRSDARLARQLAASDEGQRAGQLIGG